MSSSTSVPVRVLVVARDNLTRAGLAAMIDGEPGLFLCGRTGNDNLPVDIELYGPDIVVLDISQDPEIPAGIQDSGVPVVAIVSDDAGAALAWNNRIRGILTRDVKPARLVAAIRAVTEGLTAVDARFADTLVSPENTFPNISVEALTERELQVLQLVAEGLPNKSIAATLAISEHTVKFHVNSILSKTGAQSRTQAVTLATRLGLIKL